MNATKWKVGDIAYTFAMGTQRKSKEQMYPVEILFVVPTDVDPSQHYIVGVDNPVEWYTDYRDEFWLYTSPEEWEQEQAMLKEKRKELLRRIK